jgi:uncharacterized protein (DUF2141 family)
MFRIAATLLLTSVLLHAKDVTITVTGVRNAKGRIAALVFSNEKGFPDVVKAAAHQAQIPAKAGTVVLKFSGVPAGRYAVSILHDEDGDGKLATNFIGIPREGVGISNGFGDSRPKFAKSLTDIKPGDNLTIALRYP